MSDITVLFEQSLRQSGKSLESFLAEQTISTTDRNDADVVTQLACVDLTVAWGQGNEDTTGKSPPRVEDYSQRLPALSPEPVELVEAEYRARLQRGETPEHSDYTERFPHLTEVLPQRLAEIDRSVSSELTESDAAAETIIQPSATTPAETIIGDVPVTLIESKAPPSNPEDLETIVQSESDAPTAPLRKTRGPGSASRVLRTFGDYEVLSEIARGGMGVVYRARQTKLNRVVAVKMILQGQLASKDDIQRFYSEAEAAARLEHPGIVPVFEVGEIDDQHYFSMGFVDGESLADLARRGPLPPREAAELLRDVADAIEYAHQNGVVHRDLKPGNILLTQDGQPRVTDFGLAKTVEGDSGLTASGQILGTPGYMPPEQAAGRIHDVGPLSDVYSLGAVLYCLLTGRPPFQSARVMETLKQVVEAPPVSPRLLNPSVDRDLETIVLKCLEKEPAHRLASAAELRDELQKYLNGEPIQSRRVGFATRLWRWCRRKPLAAALVASVFVLSGAVTLTVQLAQSAAQTREFATALGEFEQTLDNAEPTAQWLRQAEQIAGRLEELTTQHGDQQSLEDDSGEQVSGRDARPRVHEAFAALIRRDLRKPKLDTDSADRIQEAIRLLQDRSYRITDELQSLLDRRLTDWLIDFDLTSPFDDRSTVDAVFREAEVLVSDGTLQPASQETVVTKEVGSAASGSAPEMPAISYAMAPLILAKTSCQDDVQIEATFASDWQSAQEVGVSLNSGADSGYDFVVKTLKVKARSGGFAESVTFKTLEDALKGDGSLVAEIRRNGAPLHRRPLKLSAGSNARLQLRARRVRGHLEFQVNEQAPIQFYDPFSIGSRSPGRFGLRWPAGVNLVSLTAQHRPRGEAVSGLESGDALVDEQKFEDAAEQYRQQMAEASDDAIREEAQYKLGVCLTALKRHDEAQELLGPLMADSNGQWAALAGTQLWVSAIRSKQTQNADVIFETLQSRFQFEELAALIPNDVRKEILSGYLNAFTSVSNALKFDANRVRNIERGAAVDRLLSHDGLGHYGRQMELVRAYRFTGEWTKALAALKPLLERSRDTVSVRHFARISRFAGQPEQALEMIDGIVSGRIEAQIDDPEALVWYLVDRARLHYTMGNLAAAEHDARRVVEIGLSDPERHLNSHNHSQAALMLGFLLEARGQKQAAIDLWRDGYRRCQSLYDHLGAAYHTGLVATQALGSLSGELSDDDGSRFLKIMTANDSGQSLVTMGSSLVTPQTITEALRDMWRTKRGRAAAREFAFETLPLRERLALPMLLMGHAFVRAKALGRIVSDEQDELIWRVMSDSHRDFMERGTLKMPQLMQLALTWKGTTNFLGWSGVAPLLAPEYRAEIAWMFGHRFLRLGQRDAARSFFETAVKHAPAKSLTARVAQTDLTLLKNEKARLSIAGLSSPGIEVRQGKTVVATLDQENSVVELKPGDYSLAGLAPKLQRLQCETPTSLEAGRQPTVSIRLPVASSATVEVSEKWQSDTDSVPLPGLIGQPAELPGIGRWQVVRASPQGELRGVTFSPDGRFVAAGCDDGLVRIYETANWSLARIFSGHRRAPERAEWSPDSRYLAVMDRGHEFLVWDVLTGRLLNWLPNLQENKARFAWHPKSQSLVVGNYSVGGARHVSIDGTLLELFGAEHSQPTPSWSPDGSRLAIVNKASGAFEIWQPRSADVPDVLGIFGFEGHGGHTERRQFGGLELEKPALEVVQTDPPLWLLAAWSPDGRQVATAAPERIAVWDTASWRQLQSWDTKATAWMKWQADSQHLWSAAWSGPVEIRTVTEALNAASRTSADESASANHEDVEFVKTGRAHGLPGLHPNGELLARPSHGRLQLFERDGALAGDVPWEDAFIVRSLDWSPDGKHLAVAMGSGVVLFDLERIDGPRNFAARQTGAVDPKYAYISCVR